jgi:hypothetical protein
MANFDIDWDTYNKVYGFVYKEGLDLKRPLGMTKSEVAKISKAMGCIAVHTVTIDAISEREVGTLSEKEVISINQALMIMAEQVDLIREILRKGCARSN